MSNVTFGGGPYVEGDKYTGSDGREYEFKNGCMVFCEPDPNEVQVGGTMPDPDSSVEFWITPDGPKTKNDEGIWVAVPNYKGGA